MAPRSPQSKGLVGQRRVAESALRSAADQTISTLLRDIATHVAASGDPEFFSTLARYLARKLGADVVCIAELTGPSHDHHAHSLALYLDGKSVANVPRTLVHTACGCTLERGECTVVDNARAQFPNDDVLQRHSIESYAGVALYETRGAPIGVISVLWRARTGNADFAARLLSLVAARTAGEIERRRVSEQMPRLNRLLRTMRQINKIIVRGADDSYIYSETCRMLVEHGGFRAAWIGNLRPGGEIQPLAHAGIADGAIDLAGLRCDADTAAQAPAARAIVTGEAVICSAQEDPYARAFGSRSCAAFPLYKTGRAIGAITLYSADAHAFDTAEVDLLDDLAGDISHALQSLDEADLRRHAEAALHESQRMFATLVSNLPGAVYRCANDRHWTTEFMSDGCLALTGYAASDFLERRRRYSDLVDAKDQEWIWREVQAALDRRAPYQLTYPIRTAAGVQKWVWEQGRGVFGADGQLVCLEGFVTDVTARKEAEAALQASEERFRSLTALSSDWYWEQDDQLRFTLVTHNEEPIIKNSRPPASELLGRCRWELPHHDMSDAEWAPHRALLQARLPFKDFILRSRVNDGSVRFSGISGVPIFDAGGIFRGYRGTGRDLTERMRAEEQMHKLSSAIQQTADCVMITNRDGVIEYVNAAFEQTTGYLSGDVLGSRPSKLKSGLHDEEFYRRLWRQILAGETFRDVFINRKQNGELYYEEKTISPLRNNGGVITHFISTGKDITDRMQAQERLHYLAHHDALTGLPNRVLFLDRLNHALTRAHWYRRVVAVMFLDFDRFKNINDTLGHDVGDALLRALAQRLQERVRDGDSVARFGGDEFAVLLEDIAHVEDVSMLAAKLLDAFSQPFVVQSHELYITASIGISMYPNDGDSAATLLRNADTAMYRAKDVGKNNYQFYSADMSAAAFERLRLETNLRHALERDEFVMHYQPQIELATGRILGVEALIRWQPPEFGLLDPAHFVGVAEETGSIIQVGAWALRTAMLQGKRWHAAGYSSLRVAINVSARQLNEPAFVELLARVIQETGFPPSCLELEITESVIMDNAERMNDRLRRISSMGVQFSIDDFGTGYSSLSYLRRFPIQTLKIDKSFIRDLTDDSGDAEIVKTIIAMARNLKLAVVAEGLETREQLIFLQSHGCYAAQGYYLSRPLAVERITDFIRSGDTRRLLFGTG